MPSVEHGGNVKGSECLAGSGQERIFSKSRTVLDILQGPQWTGLVSPRRAQTEAGQAAVGTKQFKLLSSSLCLCQPKQKGQGQVYYMYTIR